MRFRPRQLNHRRSSNRDRLTKLSVRQMEVLSLLVDGKSNKEIANDLSISPDTVKTHISHIYRTLQVRNRAEAAVFWMTTVRDA